MQFLRSRLFLRTGSVALLLLVPVWVATAAAQSPSAFQKAWQSGTPVSVSGVLTVLLADDFSNRRADLMHIVRDERTNRTFQLRFEAGAPGQLRSGARVTVRGRAHESEIYLAAADRTGFTIQSSGGAVQQTAAVAGDQKTLVIVAHFRDKVVNPLVPGADCSVPAISDRMFTDPLDQSVDDMYRDTSVGKVSFSGQVVGPYTLAFASTDGCDLSGWASAADAQAAADGVDPEAYTRKVYVMPSNPVCGASGIGELGVSPSRAWVFTCDLPRIYAHELGHNLGMHHSSTETDEYGDDSDPMGSMGRLKPVNAPHKTQMGWLPEAQVMGITQDGLYDVAPLALDPAVATAPQVLQVSRPDSTDHYYLSYRHANTGFEANLYPQYLDRISVHRWAGDINKTYLLAMLAAGETFADISNGLTVTHVSHSDVSATAHVKLGNGCGATVPLLTLSPIDQSGRPGAAVSYDVEVVNNDSATCGPSTLVLGSTVPSGWTAAVSPATLQLAPGGTGRGTLTVTSPISAASGTYLIGVSTSDGVSATHTASASGNYAVLTGDTTPPSAPRGLLAKLKSRQVYLSWLPAADNVAVAGYQVWRNGVVMATTTGASWVDRAVTAGSTYTYWIVAFDAAANASASSNSALVQLTGGSGRVK